MNNQFEDERRTGIGGSDVAACFSIDRGCARRLTYEKRGIVPDFPDPYRPEYERGKDLEAVAIQKYQRETGNQVVGMQRFFRHAQYPHMICHVDGIVANGPNAGALVEVKVLNQWHLKQIKKNGLPNAYILQMQHMLETAPVGIGQFALLCPDPWELFVLPPIKRDEDLIEVIVSQEEDIWKAVTEGPMPDKLDPTDPRCQVCPFRKTCQGSDIVQAMIPKEDQTKNLENDPELAQLAEEIWQAKELVSEAKALEADLTKTMKAMIGKRDGIIVPGGRFILTRSYPRRWDTEALWGSLDLFPLLEKYIKETPKDKPQITLRGYRTGD